MGCPVEGPSAALSSHGQRFWLPGYFRHMLSACVKVSWAIWFSSAPSLFQNLPGNLCKWRMWNRFCQGGAMGRPFGCNNHSVQILLRDLGKTPKWFLSRAVYFINGGPSTTVAVPPFTSVLPPKRDILTNPLKLPSPIPFWLHSLEKEAASHCPCASQALVPSQSEAGVWGSLWAFTPRQGVV